MSNRDRKFCQFGYTSAKRRSEAIKRLSEDGYTDIETYTANSGNKYAIRVYLYSGTAEETYHVRSVAFSQQ